MVTSPILNSDSEWPRITQQTSDYMEQPGLPPGPTGLTDENIVVIPNSGGPGLIQGRLA